MDKTVVRIGSAPKEKYNEKLLALFYYLFFWFYFRDRIHSIFIRQISVNKEAIAKKEDMNIQAKVLSTKIIVQCKDKPVRFHNLEIGKITDSCIRDGNLLVDISINKRFIKSIKKILSQPNIISIEMGDEVWLPKKK